MTAVAASDSPRLWGWRGTPRIIGGGEGLTTSLGMERDSSRHWGWRGTHHVVGDGEGLTTSLGVERD